MSEADGSMGSMRDGKTVWTTGTEELDRLRAELATCHNAALEKAAKVCDELEDYLWNYGHPSARNAVQDVSGRIRALKEKP